MAQNQSSGKLSRDFGLCKHPPPAKRPAQVIAQKRFFSWPIFAVHPITDTLARQALVNSVTTYGIKIDESPMPKIDDRVLEQLAAL